jgi:preprotein translocase subunit SecD
MIRRILGVIPAGICLLLLLAPASEAEALFLEAEHAREVRDYNGQHVVHVQLTRASTEQFARFTVNSPKKTVIIRLDGRVLASPFIQTPLHGGTLQLGSGLELDAPQARAIAEQIREGGKLTIDEAAQ